MVQVRDYLLPVSASGVDRERLPKRAALVVALVYRRRIGLLEGAANRESSTTVSRPFLLMFKHPLVHGLDMCRVTRQVAGSVHPVLTTILALLALGKPGTYTDTPFTRVCVCNALIR